MKEENFILKYDCGKLPKVNKNKIFLELIANY
jgi:hypothetical protein